MKLNISVFVLTAICAAETLLGGVLTIRYAAAGAYGAMAVQLAGFLISLMGTAFGAYWLKDHWRK